MATLLKILQFAKNSPQILELLNSILAVIELIQNSNMFGSTIEGGEKLTAADLDEAISKLK